MNSKQKQIRNGKGKKRSVQILAYTCALLACWSRLAGAAYMTREVTLGSFLGSALGGHGGVVVAWPFA